MRLYVANATRQIQELHYRLDFNERNTPDRLAQFRPASRQPIAPGKQIMVGNKDLHPDQVESVIQQLTPFGAIAVMEVGRHKGGRAPYVWNTEHPVPAKIIEQVIAMNAGILIAEGQRRRENAAIATNELVDRAVSETFAHMGIPKAPEQEVEVEFEQLEQSEAGERRIEEGYRLDANAPPPKGPSGRNAPWSPERRARFEAGRKK